MDCSVDLSAVAPFQLLTHNLSIDFKKIDVWILVFCSYYWGNGVWHLSVHWLVALLNQNEPRWYFLRRLCPPCIESDHGALVTRSLIVQEEQPVSFSRVQRILRSFWTLMLSNKLTHFWSLLLILCFHIFSNTWILGHFCFIHNHLADCGIFFDYGAAVASLRFWLHVKMKNSVTCPCIATTQRW